MTLSKFTNQPANEEIVNTINDIIDSMGSTTSANIDLSNLSSTGNSKFQTPLVSGTNIKTINNTSLLGSGNIDTTEVFVAEYDVTSYADVLAAYNAGKTIYVKYTGDGVISEPIGYYSFVEYNNIIPPESFIFSRTHGTLIENVIVSYSLINQGSTIWNMTSTTAANTTLSNVSSIDSNSAVKTALDGKVSKSGDTMTGDLAISEDATAKIELTNTSFDSTSTTAPTSNLYAGAIDIFGLDNYHVGHFRTRHSSANYFQSQMGVRRSINNTDYEANITVSIRPDGTTACTFPDTTCVDGQWVKNFASLSTSSAVGTYNLTNTLKAQLPNDSYNYEILLAVNGRSTGSSQCSLKTAYTSEEFVLWLTANSRSAGTFIILPVDAARTLTQKVTGTAFAAININLEAYRRVGTNS